MLRCGMGAVLGALLAAAAMLPPVPRALAASLPEPRFGEPPGPPLLYEQAPAAPELSLRRPFAAEPLLVSGTDAHREGEYLYQDYLFDDHGADTRPGLGNQAKPGPDSFSPAAGDVAYPTAARFAGNAADIVEFRVKPTRRALVYRITLNTITDPDVPIVGIGIDEDRSGGAPVEWPGGAGLATPGLDRFITAWGTGGELTDLSDGSTRSLDGRVEVSRRTNQVTIRVPRSLMDPSGATWRYVAGVGLHDGSGGFEQVEPGSSPQPEAPTSGSTGPAAAVFNLAFRFDEPQTREPTPPYTTGPGVGNWFEDRQARLLADGRTGNLRTEVDFGSLAAGGDRWLHRPGREQARIFVSGLDLPEGVSDGFPQFGGRLQPYLLTVPRGDNANPAGLTFSLHSLAGTYTQYAVFSPNQLDQFGQQRGNLVATPLGRGPDGWYTGPAEVDFFEVWHDVAGHYRLDPRRVYPSGYSMGGYGTYRLGVRWPDLFARAFTTVGPPAEGVWVPPAPPSGGEVSNTNPLLESVRWIPYMNWVGLQDQLVPYPGPAAQQDRFDRLGLRSTLETFQAEHFTLATLDEWGAAADFLGDARVRSRPSRVNFAFFPEAHRRGLGLVPDHAYWVHGLVARNPSGDPESDPARAEIDARSQAFGAGAPRVRRVRTVGMEGRPSPSEIRGTRWAGIRDARERNRLVVALENLRRAVVDGRGARLDGDVGERPLRVRVESDGNGLLRIDLQLPAGAVARRIDGSAPTGGGANGGGATDRAASDSSRTAAAAPEVTLRRNGATFRVAGGKREYLITRPERLEDKSGGDGSADGTRTGGGRSRFGAGGSGVGDPGDRTAAIGGAAGAGRGEGGSLPFTGFGLLLLAGAGAAAVAGGRALRRTLS